MTDESLIPPVPPDLDLRAFPYMPLEVARLVDSELAALASGDEFRAAVILWCKAWHQVPASSLPDNDNLLCSLAGFGRDLKTWDTVKARALHGFRKHGDGRLYHLVIAGHALNALESQNANKARTQAATAARKGRKVRPRDDGPDGERDETSHDQRDDPPDPNVTFTNRTKQNRKEDKDSRASKAYSPLAEAEAVGLWNDLAVELKLPTVQRLTDARRTKLRGRLGELGGIDGWNVALGKIKSSAFLRGESGRWRIFFDWMLSPQNIAKVMEGNYDDRKSKPANGSGRAASAIADERERLLDRYGDSDH